MLLYVVYKYMVKKVVIEPAVLDHMVAIDVQKAGVELQVPTEEIRDSKEAMKANEETNGRDKGKKGEEDGREILPAWVLVVAGAVMEGEVPLSSTQDLVHGFILVETSWPP